MFWTSEKKFFDVQIFLTNYWINLVDAGHMEDISCFQTDLQKIMGMLKCKNKGDDLRKYMDNPPEGMTSEDIRRMSEDDLLDMDYFLNEDDLFNDETGVEGFYIF